MRIYSWNVNGLRAGLRRGTFQAFVEAEHPDIFCLQETKAQPGQAEVDLPEYTELWNSAERPGYSGTAIFSQTPPLSSRDDFSPSVQAAFPWPDCAHGNPLCEGRIQTAEYPEFYLVNVYVPNSKRDLSRLAVREQIWDPALLQYLQELEQQKPVVVCGDFNAAHTEIDLARPKQNVNNAGFTTAERQGITNLLAANFVDTFRALHPDAERYTWWAHWGKARENNVGWRIDYFFISKALLPHLKAADIHESILGSDHCPVSIELEF